MAFTLPALPYPDNALEPHISQETLTYHYGKHHAGYVNKLNAAVEGTNQAKQTLEEIIRTASPGGVFNCAAQTWNHTFYWSSMSPNGGGEPTGTMLKLIEQNFGSFDQFKEKFSQVAAGHFGSGWAWLVQDPKDLSLQIKGTHDAANPMTDNLHPILTCDVWEHAYYIDYRNDRAKYIQAWWNLVNWDFAEKNLLKSSL